MPLQNRVDPFGAIHVAPQRGLLMGNRGGKIHDPATKTLLKRRFASRRWIICECVYKDWHRKVMGAGYTELFFLDDVTALAAGHRPCAFCRRGPFTLFRQCYGPKTQSVDDMDRVLHDQRLSQKPNYRDQFFGATPDGVMIGIGDEAYAKRHGMALRWSFDGYVAAGSWDAIAVACAKILTPLLTVTALQNGYVPIWHPSASL